VKNKVKNAIKESKEEKDSLFKEIKLKSQAAMEYLMTYGWAILIIALTLAVLYSLGIMNPKNFIPRAPPGSCFVFRPNGPGTTDFVSLQGTCGYLPMYVASFNRVNSRIGINPATWSQSIPLTISFWVNPAKLQSYSRAVTSGSNGNRAWSFYFATGATYITFEFYDQSGSGHSITGGSFPVGKWGYVAAVVMSSIQKLYINGALVSSAGNSITSFNPNALSWFGIGGWGDGSGDYLNGSVANVQIYNTALTDQEIQYLYQQGLGGGPVRLQNLVGWWPLNGDAKDYSGNNLHGTIYGGVTFVQNYNPP